MYVDVARTYALFVRNKKIFHDIPGYIFITTYRNCIASRVYETCSQLCMFKKCLILLRPSAKMTFHCYLQWIWGPNNMTVSLFFLEHVSQNCHKGFLKASVGDTKPNMHFKERDHHPTPNFLRSINHVGKFKERDHHPTPPHVASTMSASSRNVIIAPPHPCRPPGNPPSLGSYDMYTVYT